MDIRWAREEKNGDLETERAYFLGLHTDLEQPEVSDLQGSGWMGKGFALSKHSVYPGGRA